MEGGRGKGMLYGRLFVFQFVSWFLTGWLVVLDGFLFGRLSGGGFARFVSGWLVVCPPTAPRSRGRSCGGWWLPLGVGFAPLR